MLRHRLFATAFFLASAFGMADVCAQVRPGPTDTVVDARAWLTRIHDAASTRNYQGTQVYTAAGVVSSSRIAHYCEGSDQYERVEMLDGQMRRVFRYNDTVYTLWPDKQTALVQRREAMPPFPALLSSNEQRFTEHYELRLQGDDRLAGHDSQVFFLKPNDKYRFAQRLWADKASGLLLRADVLGPHGEVLESSAFSEVAIDVKPQPESVMQPLKRLEGYKVIRPVSHATQMENEGWTLRSVAPGFQQISCIKRPLDVPGDGNGQSDEVVQAIFSDGLTHVSLFIEPFDPQRHQRQGSTAIGATHTLMRQQGQWWVTVVGDVPLSTLKLFAQALERRR
ncbi:MAG TPA: MucB/RseB C-terminal domain-containing protein [Burkholderiaceae bacterium]|nr:MucB/RseB C-terminal domain-containing protein [Burkholderiaceae bacterium]